MVCYSLGRENIKSLGFWPNATNSFLYTDLYCFIFTRSKIKKIHYSSKSVHYILFISIPLGLQFIAFWFIDWSMAYMKFPDKTADFIKYTLLSSFFGFFTFYGLLVTLAKNAWFNTHFIDKTLNPVVLLTFLLILYGIPCFIITTLFDLRGKHFSLTEKILIMLSCILVFFFMGFALHNSPLG